MRLSHLCALVLTLIVAACQGPAATPHPSASLSLTEKASTLNTKSSCQSAGGSWKKSGRSQQYNCVLKSSDGGKACNDNSECEVACVANKTQSITPGMKLSGVCLADTEQFGCKAYIEKGRTQGVLCID